MTVITTNSSPPHICNAPADFESRTLNWTCGICGAVYSPTQYGWTQVRGPSGEDTDG